MAGAGNPTGGAGVGVGVVGSGGGRRKLGMISKGMLVTAAGVGAFSVAWHFKADEIRELLDDTFIDHAAVWVTDRIAEVCLCSKNSVTLLSSCTIRFGDHAETVSHT